MPEQETVFPQIEAMLPKVNSPELLAIFQAYGIQNYADAEFFNLLRAGMLELYNLFQLSGGRRISKTISSTAYTVTADDYNKLLLFTAPAPVTVTVPLGLDLNIIAIQSGSGQVSFEGAVGVQVLPPVDSFAKTENKGSVIGLIRTEAEKYSVIGKLELI